MCYRNMWAVFKLLIQNWWVCEWVWSITWVRGWNEERGNNLCKCWSLPVYTAHWTSSWRNAILGRNISHTQVKHCLIENMEITGLQNYLGLLLLIRYYLLANNIIKTLFFLTEEHHVFVKYCDLYETCHSMGRWPYKRKIRTLFQICRNNTNTSTQIIYEGKILTVY